MCSLLFRPYFNSRIVVEKQGTKAEIQVCTEAHRYKVVSFNVNRLREIHRRKHTAISMWVAVTYPQHHFVHRVQLSQVALCVRVGVVQVYGSCGSVTGLSYHGPQGPRELMDQIRANNHVLDQPAWSCSSWSRHFSPGQEVSYFSSGSQLRRWRGYNTAL